MALIDTYSKVMGEIQSLFRSRLQVQILLSLYGKNRTLSQLREITGSTSQALIPKIRKLESKKYIEISDYHYFLTPTGRILAGKMSDLIMFQAVVSKHRMFWSEHYIEGIPGPYLSQIGMLHEADIVSDTRADVFHVFLNYLKAVKEAQKIHILSPVSSPAHIDAVAKRVEEGIPIEIVVGEDLAGKLIHPPYIEMVREISKKGKNRLLVFEAPLRLSLTVTDAYLSLGLYKVDMKTFDNTTDLVGTDGHALAWGEAVFEYFRESARELEI